MAQIRRSMSSSFWPWRAMRQAGMRMPSSKIDFKPPAMDPGTAPPTSEWCAMLAAKKRSTPSQNTGVTMLMSGRWLPSAR
ncbi:hypothetical protein D3C86_1658180 [compost metagenome]